MPEQPSRVVLGRFQCVREPPGEGELARVDCRVSGILIWNNGRRQRLPGRRAYFRQVAGYGSTWLSSGLYDRSTAHPDR